MHRNENKYDQLFRNRLRDLTHPVRNELWSRIHSGIKAPKTSVPGQPLRKFWLSPATSLTVAAAAALAITLGIIYFTRTIHTVTPPSAHPVGSVTPKDSSRDRSVESATPKKNMLATGVPAAPATTVTGLHSTPENTASAVQPSHGASASKIGRDSSNLPHGAGASKIGRSLHARPLPDRSLTSGDRLASGSHLSPEDRTTSARHRHTSADAETMPGTSDFSIDPAQPHPFHHNGNSVSLPPLAYTSNRAAITADAPGSKSLHNSSITPVKAPHFQRTLSVSLYGSPDFPSHNYTWSYTAGFRATLQFSPHWSFTAGFEYARVNVPTQVIPPIGYGDTLHSFYFSNYEVPVLFGYTRTFRHSTLTVNGGAILNLYFHRSTGVWVFNLPDRDSYGAVLGIDYTRPVSRHLAIFAQPYARYSISDYRMFIQSQRWSFGTLLGIKYQL